MSTIVVAQIVTAPVLEQLPLSIPLSTYAEDHDSAERAEPSPPMQPSTVVRNRGVEGRSARNDETTSESTPTTTQTLVADPDDDGDQEEGKDRNRKHCIDTRK